MKKKGMKPIPLPHSISASPNTITIHIYNSASAKIFIKDAEDELCKECIVLEVISQNPTIANAYPISGTILIQAMEPGYATIIIGIPDTSISTTIQVQVISDSTFDSFIKRIKQNLNITNPDIPQPISC